jgi:beta-glucosidase
MTTGRKFGLGAAWVASVVLGPAGALPTAAAVSTAAPEIVARAKPALTVGGVKFHDLNANGQLDPYEDWRLSPEARADDLLGRMTLEEKAGQMMHGTAPTSGLLGRGAGYDRAGAEREIGRGVGAVITRLAGDYASIGTQNDMLQELAEGSRLGVPIMVSTDPRNQFSETEGAAVAAGGFSKWPETLGLAAIGDVELVRRFGDIVRQEYRAAGINQALSPQADLSTEPRWARTAGTFGEDADLTGRMARAYVEGFQGGANGITRSGVATVVKHWAGYGAAKDGWDSHSAYGRFATLPGTTINYHLKPYEEVFKANPSGIMPTYSILEGATVDGKGVEPIAAGFSKVMLTDLLRGRYGFKGVILSDWLITEDCPAACQGQWQQGQPPSIGMPWGVENLTRTQRFALAVEAGVDQFGGVSDKEPLLEAVRAGRVTEARINESVRRILVQKFQLGLFENAYSDQKLAAELKQQNLQAEADRAQARSLVVLEDTRNVLPLKAGAKLYLKGVSAEAATSRGFVVVDAPEKADVAIVRLKAPFQTPHPNYFFGRSHHEGDLDFKDGEPEFEAFKTVAAKAPTIATVYLDRPAILTGVKSRAAGLVANFGASDTALLDGLSGKIRPQGKLPFELPSSMAAVNAQMSELPHDSVQPLYPIFYSRPL